MKDQKQNKEKESEELDKGQKIEGRQNDSCQEACGEIADRIRSGGIPVTINPATISTDRHHPQFLEIKNISEFIKRSRIDFNCYKKLMDSILNDVYSPSPSRVKRADLKNLCYEKENPGTAFADDVAEYKSSIKNAPLFSSSKSYHILKYATERYVNIFLGLDPGDMDPIDPRAPTDILPYIKLIQAKLSDVTCNYEVKFRPMFAELIWSYWHEEGMMVHTINAIANRFQNKRTYNGVNPLGNLALDPLRPLNNLVWGYIQDKINLLTPRRRSFEYDHQYGLTLFAAGPASGKTSDSRSSFIQAFHNLLYKCTLFYREADNLMKVPDAFPVLNALREVHLLLSEGADNQFGDLPFTARTEMMIEQYILARSEVREFLGGRVMVPYDEAWMDRVDSMKTLQGWPGASISYFHDLARYGEEILLAIRWISWSQINNRDFAREWSLLFRDAVQRYVHCYQAVTGVDISAIEVSGPEDQKAIMPSFLIRRKARRDLIARRR